MLQQNFSLQKVAFFKFSFYQMLSMYASKQDINENSFKRHWQQ